MVEPKHAYRVIYNIIEKKLSPTVKDPEELRSKCIKYAKKIKKAGYKILMDKYNILTEDELMQADSLYAEYCAMFENAGLAIAETNALNRLRRGELDPEMFFTMTLDQLRPEANREIHEDIEIRSNIKIQEKTSSMYQCICGERRTIVESKQLAGADEPPCVTARCVKCNRKWVTGF